MKPTMGLVALVLLQLSCTDGGVAPQDHGTGPLERSFNLLVRYGVGARNELDTFNDTFTKDLIADGTVETRLELTQSDFDTIASWLESIGILSYPDTLVPPHTDTVVYVFPHPTYVLKLKFGDRWKQVFWDDMHEQSDSLATGLRGALQFIRMLIEAKPEYKKLPPARGGYA